jgi:hypothetical protein
MAMDGWLAERTQPAFFGGANSISKLHFLYIQTYIFNLDTSVGSCKELECYKSSASQLELQRGDRSIISASWLLQGRPDNSD